MAGATEGEQICLNTFQEETDSKAVEKQTVNLAESENDIISSTASIVYGEDEAVSNIQVEPIVAAAKSMESVALSTRELKTINPDIAAALHSTLETDGGEGTSSGIRYPTSHSEWQLTATEVEKMCRHVLEFPTRAAHLEAIVNISTVKLYSHMDVFSLKVAEANKREKVVCKSEKNFYEDMASEYGKGIKEIYKDDLKYIEKVNFSKPDEIITYFRRAASDCFEHVKQVQQIPFEMLKGTITWTHFLELINVFLGKEHDIILNFKQLWIKVHHDLKKVSKQSWQSEYLYTF